MSGICGIINIDGAPADPGLLTKMAHAAAHRGPDGIAYWIESNVGLAHLAFHTTPEALREKQPLHNSRNDAILVADARVDNRDELIRTLTAKAYLQDKDPTDADLILAAYECWGEACPKHIVGDFAFAIWDCQEQRLFCARDPIGIKPLFYCQRGQTFFFASAIASILAGLGECPPLNDLVVVDFLCYRFDRWVYETIYQEIYRVPASHYLELHQGESRLSRYWTFGLMPDPRYKDDAEYVDHFRALFGDAIRCRLRSTTPIGISVSGGLDSSSIACMAHHMLEAGDAHIRQPIRLYSYFFEDFAGADEREYSQAVADTCHRFTATFIPGEQVWGLEELGMTETARLLDEPDIDILRNMWAAPMAEAHQQGCRIVLAGYGGDELLGASAYWKPALIFDIGFQLTELRYFWKLNGWSTIVKLIRDPIAPTVLSFFKPFVPSPLVKRLKQQRLSRHAQTAFPWMREDKVAESLTSTPKTEKLLCDGTPLLHSQSAIATYQALTSGKYTASLNYFDSVAAFMEIEYRLPYYDRHLIDFMLAIPPRQRFADGSSKAILRKAMKGILPAQVCQRIILGGPGTVVVQHRLRQEQSRIETLLEKVGRGQSDYLDAEELAAAWQMYYMGKNTLSRALFAPLLLQAWLQSPRMSHKTGSKQADQFRR